MSSFHHFIPAAPGHLVLPSVDSIRDGIKVPRTGREIIGWRLSDGSEDLTGEPVIAGSLSVRCRYAIRFDDGHVEYGGRRFDSTSEYLDALDRWIAERGPKAGA